MYLLGAHIGKSSHELTDSERLDLFNHVMSIKQVPLETIDSAWQAFVKNTGDPALLHKASLLLKTYAQFVPGSMFRAVFDKLARLDLEQPYFESNPYEFFDIVKDVECKDPVGRTLKRLIQEKNPAVARDEFWAALQVRVISEISSSSLSVA